MDLETAYPNPDIIIWNAFMDGINDGILRASHLRIDLLWWVRR